MQQSLCWASALRLAAAIVAWGFAAALHTWYIASNEAERERARASALAFGARDVLWTIKFGYYTAAFYGLIGPGINGGRGLS